MSKEPDAEFDRLVKKLIKDIESLHFFTKSLDERTHSVDSYMSTVLTFKKTYDSKHSEKELKLTIDNILHNLSYAFMFTASMTRKAVTLQK